MGSARHLLTEGKGPEAALPCLQGSIDHGTMRCALATVGGRGDATGPPAQALA